MVSVRSCWLRFNSAFVALKAATWSEIRPTSLREDDHKKAKATAAMSAAAAPPINAQLREEDAISFAAGSSGAMGAAGTRSRTSLMMRVAKLSRLATTKRRRSTP